MQAEDARALFERLRWGGVARCPTCGAADTARLRSARAGLYKCRKCARQFTVTVGTPLHHTRLDLGLWLYALEVFVVARSVRTTAELARELGINYRTALLVVRRLRHAASSLPPSPTLETAAAALIGATLLPRRDYLADLDEAFSDPPKRTRRVRS